MVASTVPTSERIVTAATQLFADHGYGATSVADLLRVADANSGSLYHAFPAKQDVLIAVLKRHFEGIFPNVLEPAWSGVEDPIARVFALLGHYRALLAASDCSYSSPVGSLALELHDPDPAVRAWLAANFTAWVAAVEGCLHAAGDRLSADIDRAALAQLVLTVMEGGVMQARTHRSLTGFDAGVAMLRDYFIRLQEAAR